MIVTTPAISWLWPGGGQGGGMGGLGHRAEMIHERETRLGQFHALAGAGKEADAEFFFQRCDLPSERRLGEAQRPRGG